MAKKETPKFRQGTEVDPSYSDSYAKRRHEDTVISSNGVFTKIQRDGKVEVIPTSEVYAHEADDRVEGIEVADPTVTGPLGATLVDRAQREFNTGERGDAVSAQHAQGASGTIPEDREPEIELDEGAYEEDLENWEEDHAEAVEAAEEAAEKPAKKAVKKAVKKAPAKKAAAKKAVKKSKK